MARTWRTATVPRITPDEARFGEFAGVVNTRSRTDIGHKALFVGDNVFISDTKKVTRRDGYSAYLTTGSIRSAYGETGMLYVVDSDQLLHVASATQTAVITNGLSNGPYCWDDINGDAHFVNGVDAGIVRGTAYLPWRLTVPSISAASALSAVASGSAFNMGDKYVAATFRMLATFTTADGRETAPSEITTLTADPLTNLIRVTCTTGYASTNVYCTEADGTVFRKVATGTGVTFTFNPARGGEMLDEAFVTSRSLPPGVTHIAFCGGRCFAGQYFPALRMSAIWISQPYAFHLWNMAKDMQALPGEIALLLWNNSGVLIGTTQRIYQYDEDSEKAPQLADYGVIPGVAGDVDAQGTAYFWTERGMCKAMPFENLTEKDVSMAPGARAVAAMVYLNGVQQFITVAQGGGEAFNQRRERQ